MYYRVEEYHAAQVKALTGENEDQRSQITQMEKEINYLQTELTAQKEANVRSPSNTMKNLVERLKAQLTQKEKQLKVILLLDMLGQINVLQPDLDVFNLFGQYILVLSFSVWKCF